MHKSAAIFIDLSAIYSAFSTSLSIIAFAALWAYRPPDPIAITPSSISMQFPDPSTKTVISGSLTSKSAESYACILLVLHCLARARQARRVWPGYFSNSFSRSSIRARQSAAEPAKPHTTLSESFLSFRAVVLKTVGPRDICPSATIATWFPLRTEITVVAWSTSFGRVEIDLSVLG